MYIFTDYRGRGLISGYCGVLHFKRYGVTIGKIKDDTYNVIFLHFLRHPYNIVILVVDPASTSVIFLIPVIGMTHPVHSPVNVLIQRVHHKLSMKPPQSKSRLRKPIGVTCIGQSHAAATRKPIVLPILYMCSGGFDIDI